MSITEDKNEENGNKLYIQVKELAKDWQSVEVEKAKLIVELVDDAIREFGSTNAEKKVELKRIKEQAEIILPPKTIEELRKRAEGLLLKRTYPTSRKVRNTLFLVLAFAIIAPSFIALIKVVTPYVNLKLPSIFPKVEDIPSDEFSKIKWEMDEKSNGSIEMKMFNGTDWLITEVIFDLSVYEGDEAVAKGTLHFKLAPGNTGEPKRYSKYIATWEYPVHYPSRWWYWPKGLKGYKR